MGVGNFINYMEDGEAGVSIGLINVAKHGGKYEFEVSFSEVVNTMSHSEWEPTDSIPYFPVA